MSAGQPGGHPTHRQILNALSAKREASYTILSSEPSLLVDDQYIRTNLSQAQSWIKASDTAMQFLSNLLKLANVLAEQTAD